MAEFCRDCATDLGFPADLTIENLGIKRDQFSRVLCEGCGFMYLENHDGEEVAYRTTYWSEKERDYIHDRIDKL